MRRRTLKRYQQLYHDPKALFPEVKTLLFPNGENELWFSTDDGLGFRVEVSNGPHGLGLRVTGFVGTPNITNHDRVELATNYVELTQYRDTDKAQAFKRWYHHLETARRT